MTSQLTVEDVFSPDLTEALSDRLISEVQSAVGIKIGLGELKWLLQEARNANRERLRPPHVTGQSYKAIEDLERAAKRLRDALALIKSMADGPPAIEERDLASEFIMDNCTAADDDIDAQVDITVYPTEELINHLLYDIDCVRGRAQYALDTNSVRKRGTGRKAYGYGTFVNACHRVWRLHESAQGWSTKEGRGAGRFVTFVYTVQNLLPPPMRKLSEAAVGDAVLAALKKTK
jgi:hypothetical protein